MELPVGPQSPERHGCHGRGHIKRQCPTAFPHLKGQGKGKGGGNGWQQKGGWGKGKGDGGKGTGWGKGKSNCKGKGVYGLDLIGHIQWEGEEYNNKSDNYVQLRSSDTTDSRTPPALGRAPIAISDQFGALAGPPMPTPVDVHIDELIVKKPRKLGKVKLAEMHPPACGCC